MFTKSRVFRLTGKKLTLRFIVYVLVVRHPPYIHLTSTSRHSHDKCSQVLPSLPHLTCFCRSSTSMYYTEHKPKNKKRERPGNEAVPGTLILALHIVLFPHHSLSHLHRWGEGAESEVSCIASHQLNRSHAN